MIIHSMTREGRGRRWTNSCDGVMVIVLLIMVVVGSCHWIFPQIVVMKMKIHDSYDGSHHTEGRKGVHVIPTPRHRLMSDVRCPRGRESTKTITRTNRGREFINTTTLTDSKREEKEKTGRVKTFTNKTLWMQMTRAPTINHRCTERKRWRAHRWG